MSNKKPALFLDRDGVINKDKKYIYKIDDFEFIDGIFDLIRVANNNNYLVIVITNQAGIGRGYFSNKDFHRLNDWMLKVFQSNELLVDKVYFCPHHPNHGVGKYKKDCFNRKPNPGMILKATDDFNIDLNKSILIGDKISDIEAGISAQIKTIFLLKNEIYNNHEYDKNKHSCINVNSLKEVINILEGGIIND